MGERFHSIWDAIEDTPEQAKDMRCRAMLLTAIKDHISQHQLSQTEAAKRFGVNEQQISDLIQGKIDRFAVDALMEMTAAAGMNI